MNNIHLIENIFSIEEREEMIINLQPLLVDGKELGKRVVEDVVFPGKQTYPTLHLHSDFKEPIAKIISRIEKDVEINVKTLRGWANQSTGRDKLRWHKHDDDGADYSVVYYLKTFRFMGSGTQFRGEFIKAPQNSLIVFPSHLYHAAPRGMLFLERYSLALDLKMI